MALHFIEHDNKKIFPVETNLITGISLGSSLTNCTRNSSIHQVMQSSEFEELSFLERKSFALDSIDIEESEKFLDKSFSTDRSSYNSNKISSPILTYKDTIINISNFYLD